MDFLWGIMMLISILFSFINGNTAETIKAGFSGASSAIEILLSFAGIMCLWTGLFRAAEYSGISRLIKKLLSPLIRLLFPTLSKESPALEYISLNITANLLGIGNGATPMGIKAMRELDNGSERPSAEMCMLVVINTTAFSLIPTTVLALRSAFSSENPFSVLCPMWITSGGALLTAVICTKAVFCRRKNK